MTDVPRSRLAIGIALVAAALIVALLLLTGTDDSASNGGEPASNPQPTDGPEAASVDGSASWRAAAEDPVYWAGEQSGELELTVERDGKIFIRYLAPGVPVGSPRVPSLTVGTYPYTDAHGALQAVAKQRGATADQTPDGGLVVTTEASPSNVYVAFPGADQQIEVYHPDPARALEIATSGAIVPIE